LPYDENGAEYLSESYTVEYNSWWTGEPYSLVRNRTYPHPPGDPRTYQTKQSLPRPSAEKLAEWGALPGKPAEWGVAQWWLQFDAWNAAQPEPLDYTTAHPWPMAQRAGGNIGAPGNRNELVNSGFAVFQRTAPGTPANRVTGQYGADMWKHVHQYGASGNVTAERIAGTQTGRHALRITQPDATAKSAGVVQPRESIDTAPLLDGAAGLGQYCLRGAHARVLARSSAAVTARIAILGWTGNADALPAPIVTNWTGYAYTDFMDVPRWQANHAYQVGDYIRTVNNLVYQCSTAGTSGGSEPSWIPAGTNDGTAVWVIAAASPTFYAHGLQELAQAVMTLNPGAWTDLAVIADNIGAENKNLLVFVWAENLPQGATFDLAEAGLYKGEMAAPWQPLPIREELQACQWWYRKSYRWDVAPGTAGETHVGKGAVRWVTTVTNSFHNTYVVVPTMRTYATPVIYSPNTGATDKLWQQDVADIAGSAIGSHAGIFVQANNVSVAAGQNLQFHYTLDCSL
jgi:hypothetical protein